MEIGKIGSQFLPPPSAIWLNRVASKNADHIFENSLSIFNFLPVSFCPLFCAFPHKVEAS